jgi:hypothetical protein
MQTEKEAKLLSHLRKEYVIHFKPVAPLSPARPPKNTIANNQNNQ